jgi:uncharacterized protein (TIGR02996 family)
MTDRADLFRAVAHHPDEMTPRLMLADWLDEQPSELDRTRAEFIRLQIDLDENPPVRQCPVTGPLEPREQRERFLAGRYGKRWLAAEFPPWASQQLGNAIEWTEHPFTRGFVECARFHPHSFAERGEELFHLTPLTGADLGVKNLAALHRLVACPHLARLRFLDISGSGCFPIRDRGVQILAECPHLGTLEELDLSHSGLTDAGLTTLARSRAFGGLRELNLCDNPITPAGLEAILGSPYLSRLEVVRQDSVRKPDPDFDRLAERYPDKKLM